MTKVEGIRTKRPENPLGKVDHPAGLGSAVRPPAACRLRTMWAPQTSDFDTGKALGLQLSLFNTATVEGAVYLDLCLIFLLFRFSLTKQSFN